MNARDILNAVTVGVATKPVSLSAADTAVHSDLAAGWTLIETAYVEACAVHAGCEDVSVVSMVRPDLDTSGFLALLGG